MSILKLGDIVRDEYGKGTIVWIGKQKMTNHGPKLSNWSYHPITVQNLKSGECHHNQDVFVSLVSSFGEDEKDFD